MNWNPIKDYLVSLHDTTSDWSKLPDRPPNVLKMANAPFKIGDKEFSGVVITLENCLLPSEKLDATPSVNDGLEHETEGDLRILGCEYIQTAGVLLRLPQTAMATGQVLFQRFFYSKSLVKHNMEIVAMACVYLASKIEEAPRRIRDTINVFHHIRQRRNNSDHVRLLATTHGYWATAPVA